MMEKTVSMYKNNNIASKKKHFFAILIDFFLTFILAYVLFIPGFQISMNTGSAKAKNAELNELKLNMDEYIKNTHLQTWNEELKSLNYVDIDGANYIQNIVKTSAYIYDLNFPFKKEDGTFDTDHKVQLNETFLSDRETFVLDNLSYYYFKFKPSETTLNFYTYDGVDYSSDKTTYLYKKVLGYERLELDSYFVKEDNVAYSSYSSVLPRYLVFEEEFTKSLINFIVYEETPSQLVKDQYTILQNSYYKAVEFGVNEVQQNSEEFNSLLSQFNDIYKSLMVIVFLTMMICYVISYLALSLIAYLLTKNFVTIGHYFMKLSLASTDEMEPGLRYIPFHIINLILHVSVMVIGIMFSGLTSMLTLSVVGPINLMSILVFLLVLDLLSVIFVFISKKHQNIVCLLSGLVVKDMTDFDVPIQESDGYDGEDRSSIY